MSMISQVFFGASGMRRALFIYGRTTALRAAAPDRAHAAPAADLPRTTMHATAMPASTTWRVMPQSAP